MVLWAFLPHLPARGISRENQEKNGIEQRHLAFIEESLLPSQALMSGRCASELAD
jgi:hypothetical protein